MLHVVKLQGFYLYRLRYLLLYRYLCFTSKYRYMLSTGSVSAKPVDATTDAPVSL